MNRMLSPIVAAALVACTPAPAATEDDILRPVLAYEAGIQRERTPTCVWARTDGTAFGRDRESLRSLREYRSTNPRDAAAIREALEAAEHPSFDWRRPVPASEGDVDAMPRLDQAEADLLNRAARSLVHGEAEPERPIAIASGSVPPPLRAGTSRMNCARLSLTAPALAGDLAFVETSYVCGGLCGNGWLYALRREQGGWRLIAIAFTWIS